MRLRVASPRPRSVSGVTSAPSSKRFRSARLTGWLCGPERLERHRLLHVRAAQLAHPHVEGDLAALVAGLALVARARAGALLAAPGGPAVARALAPAHALARPPRAARRASACAARCSFVSSSRPSAFSSTSTRCATALIIPLSCRPVGALGRGADPAQAQRAQRLALRVVRAGGAFSLGDHQCRWHSGLLRACARERGRGCGLAAPPAAR